MRYPFIERSVGWDWRAVYYEPDTPGVDKVDVWDERIVCADVLLDIARLGGSHADLQSATLFEIARLVALEMQVTPTGPLIDTLSSLDPDTDASGVVLTLRGLAGEQLTGSALASAFRALAWWKFRQGPLIDLPLRKNLSGDARRALTDARCIAGYANTVADDAHAHLWVGERVRIPDTGDRRTDAMEVRDRAAHAGYVLLASAFALATRERWDPFLLNRLLREVNEHKVILSSCSSLGLEYLSEIIEEYVGLWPRLVSDWEGEVKRHGGDDIAAFFALRDYGQPPAFESLSPLARELISSEPERSRIL